MSPTWASAPPEGDACCRRHPEHDIVLDVQRSGLTSRYTLQPELDAKGDGRLGLHLASNVKYRHTKATGLPDAAMRANGALVRCFSQVLGGGPACAGCCTSRLLCLRLPVCCCSTGSPLLDSALVRRQAARGSWPDPVRALCRLQDPLQQLWRRRQHAVRPRGRGGRWRGRCQAGPCGAVPVRGAHQRQPGRRQPAAAAGGALGAATLQAASAPWPMAAPLTVRLLSGAALLCLSDASGRLLDQRPCGQCDAGGGLACMCKLGHRTPSSLYTGPGVWQPARGTRQADCSAGPLGPHLAMPFITWLACVMGAPGSCALQQLLLLRAGLAAQALDGGYLILLVLEALRGKKLSKVLEQNLVASGVLLFASLSLFLIVRDTINLGGL